MALGGPFPGLRASGCIKKMLQLGTAGCAGGLKESDAIFEMALIPRKNFTPENFIPENPT